MAWTKYKEIRYALPGIPGANLSGFPKLIEIAADADIAAELSFGGGIKFTSPNGLTDLPFGLYPGVDPSFGDVLARVKLDPLTAASVGDVLCRLYYSAVESTTEDKAGTVSNGYSLFLPLEEDPGGSAPQMFDWVTETYVGTSGGGMSGNPPGQVGNGLSFDGSNDTVALPTSLGIGTADFTAEIIAQSVGGVGPLTILLGADPSAVAFTAGWALFVSAGVLNLYTVSSPGPAATTATGVTPVDDGGMHHLAGVRQGTSLATYVDGALDGSVTGTARNCTAGAEAIAFAGPWARWHGLMDECRISSVARSADWLSYVYADESDNPTTFTLSAEQGGGGMSFSLAVDVTPYAVTLQNVGFRVVRRLALAVTAYAETLLVVGLRATRQLAMSPTEYILAAKAIHFIPAPPANSSRTGVIGGCASTPVVGA